MNHKDTKVYLKSVLLLFFCLIFLLSGGTVSANAAEKGYLHLVILGDPHLPGKNIEGKEQVIQTINSWGDADIVIPVGDICEDRGTTDEYAAAKKFFAELKKPVYAIAGNHDFIYEDLLSMRKPVRAGRDSREAKLRTFRETFGLAQNFYSKKEGNYLLVFLSPEESTYLAEMSQKQVEWLGLKLEENKKFPTIIFFHAPLQNTLRSYNRDANTPNFIAQPSRKIHNVLASNPQVFLWVSGHTHTSPKEESFASAINVYEKRITNIHNTDMNRETIWTNSLFLYPDKIVVKTYNHKKGAWLPEFERTILPPVL
jgi:Icc protein